MNPTPPPTARPIKGDEQPWKPKDFEQLAHGAIGCLFEFSGHAHLGGFDPKELELRAKEYSAHADALSAKPSPQPTQQAGKFRGAFPVLAGHCKPDEVVVLKAQFDAPPAPSPRSRKGAKRGCSLMK